MAHMDTFQEKVIVFLYNNGNSQYREVKLNRM